MINVFMEGSRVLVCVCVCGGGGGCKGFKMSTVHVMHHSNYLYPLALPNFFLIPQSEISIWEPEYFKIDITSPGGWG